MRTTIRNISDMKEGRISRYKMDEGKKQDGEKNSRRRHGCLSLVSVVCCKVDVSGRS
jgi:ribosomal protein L3